MPSDNSTAIPAETRKIEYLSQPANVSMSDGYFQIADTGHFWVRRRFQVLQQLGDDILRQSHELAEVGCGHGLLQRQIEDAYDKQVTGFDLNAYGLQHNVSRISRVCCYDIYQRDEQFRAQFDCILLFDVLEHISDEDGFLAAVLFHLADNGTLIVSVPAGPWIYSSYDRAAGHVRRYSFGTLKNSAERAGLQVKRWSYWGLPLLPTALARKVVTAVKQDLREAYASGFDVGGGTLNTTLGWLSKCETIPQHLAGTSVMAILKRQTTGIS